MAVDQFGRAMASRAVRALQNGVMTGITLGDSTTPLAQSEGVVNIPKATAGADGVMTAEQVGLLESKAGKTWTRIASADFFDPPSTVTVTRSYVLKNENCYVVNATFYSADGFGTQTDIPLKVSYAGTMLLPCGLDSQDWRIGAIGYCYVGNSKIAIGDTVGSHTYAQVHFVMPIV